MHPDPFAAPGAGPDDITADVPEVMDRDTRRQLYSSHHVHDPDGTCVRNRLRAPCDATYQPDNQEENRR